MAFLMQSIDETLQIDMQYVILLRNNHTFTVKIDLDQTQISLCHFEKDAERNID